MNYKLVGASLEKSCLDFNFIVNFHQISSIFFHSSRNAVFKSIITLEINNKIQIKGMRYDDNFI